MQIKLKHTIPLKKVVLISTPWPLHSRPSIQIGTLKSHLKKKFPDLQVHAHHFYLKVAEAIGYKYYQAISERTWLAETLYGALLYPDRFGDIQKIFNREAAGRPLLRKINFNTLVEQIKDVTEDLIGSVDWESYGLAGLSICLCQLTSSLYFIRKIKKRFPDLLIVVGGSMFSGDTTRNLFKMFPGIDIMINGEGEIPLSRLVSHLLDSQPRKTLPSGQGIVTPESSEKSDPVSFSQMKDLSGLMPPDYDDYFVLLKSFSPEKTFFPTLPMELSRGCWWQKKYSGCKFTGCAFCNLNLQWNGYRTKSPKQVMSEIDYLTTKYKTLSVAFMDNLLPFKTSRTIFNRIKKLGKDFRLFGEIRATTPREILTDMKNAGVDEVQIGIEALSTRLLKKLNKGTTAIQNIEIMKFCEMMGIVNSSNLIFCFPGSDQKDVDETLYNLKFVLPFRPLRMVQFWLGIGSPVWRHSEAFGIKAVFNHHHYAAIFPPDIVKSMQFMIQAYRGDLGYQKRLWRPVKRRIKAWQETYGALHTGPRHEPILSFRDGRDFLIIRQKKVAGEHLTHRLEGTSRAIYLYCLHHRPIKSIAAHFPRVSSDKIESFLKMMVDKKLVFKENDQYLSLAMPENPDF